MAEGGLLEVIMMSEKQVSVVEPARAKPIAKEELPESIYDRVVYFAEQVLRDEGKTNDRNTMIGPLIIEKARERSEEAKKIPEHTFAGYLSQAAKDPDCRINTRGKLKGYYLAKVTDAIPYQEMPTEKEADTEQAWSENQKEKLLYKVLEDWLKEQDYQARDVSHVRTLGTWGSPDIAGILATDILHGLDVEIVTIEVKTSYKDWQKSFFEAVSHRRFANRVYLAFAHPDETIEKIPKDMRYYCELYGIGVVVIRLENDMFRKLLGGKLSEPLTSEDVVGVTELYSAPYFYVQAKYQAGLREAIGLNSFKDFIRWGSVLSVN